MPHVMMPDERATEHMKARHANVGHEHMYSDDFVNDTGSYAPKKIGLRRKRPEKFIQEVVASPAFRKGALTKKAKAHGETPMEFAHDVLAHPEKHDLRTRRQAQFAVNAQSRRKSVAMDMYPVDIPKRK